MEQQRNLLFIGLLVLTMFIFWSWGSDRVNKLVAEQQQLEQTVPGAEDELTSGSTIRLLSDVLDMTVTLQGGDIIDVKLPKVMKTQGQSDPFELLMTTKGFVYQAQTGLVDRDGPDAKSRPLYRSQSQEYVLKEGENELQAVLEYEAEGVSYQKIFILERGSYAPKILVKVNNGSERELKIAFFGRLKQTEDNSAIAETGAFGMVASAYRGTAYSTEDHRYEKVSLEDILDNGRKKENLSIPTKQGWVAMIQHYFVSAFVADAQRENTIFTYGAPRENSTDAIIGIVTAPQLIEPGQSAEFKTAMWLGPKDQDKMEELAPRLDLTVDYGWLWFLSIPLFKILSFVHGIVGNWGVSIIVLTLIVRSLMFPLTKAQYTSMAKMRLLAPKMQELRERYKDDRAKIGQETMKLYKTEHVNPLGGCLPLVIQMPIFIALYWMLMETTELRQSSFMLWITDLSVYDPYFVLPILYGISMFFLQKMSPTPITDPVQRKVFMAMPFVFTFMFCTFPAGLTLYWLVSNCFTIFQQTVIYRSLEKKGLGVKQTKNIPSKS